MTITPKPKKARWLSDLRPSFQRALLRMHGGPVLVSEPKINAQTITALKKHGLIVEGRDRRSRAVWRPSARGYEILMAEEIRVLADRNRSTEDYTDPLDRKRALPNEPEPVDDHELERQAKDARSGQALRVHHATDAARQRLASAVADIEANPDIGELASRRLARIRRDIARLERELKAA